MTTVVIVDLFKDPIFGTTISEP